MTGARDDDEQSGLQADASTPWHHSTGKVLGASIAGIAAFALIVTGVMFASREGDSPQAPTDFVDPSFSSITARSTSVSTSTTTTRISPPLTTDLDLPPANPSSIPPPPSQTPSSQESSTTREEESEEESSEREEEPSAPTTTRNRPRLNETRTLYPRP
ncbi:hypothetical protein AU195_00185 [Mycobacterium sp. IS-1496]|uniref:hypothetical protein n=1 Tax=Mycobacterium sp. IS-1496 TaxID=1772284 RepID=UPI0007415D81|nr:hypothetical protein [Mycobacterium sp. IS-1496]KUI28666.1 hypothetical protein AU195_00185 [Mycobacterium sp. IS-1496]